MPVKPQGSETTPGVSPGHPRGDPTLSQPPQGYPGVHTQLFASNNIIYNILLILWPPFRPPIFDLPIPAVFWECPPCPGGRPPCPGGAPCVPGGAPVSPGGDPRVPGCPQAVPRQSPGSPGGTRKLPRIPRIPVGTSATWALAARLAAREGLGMPILAWLTRQRLSNAKQSTQCKAKESKARQSQGKQSKNKKETKQKKAKAKARQCKAKEKQKQEQRKEKQSKTAQ